MFVGREDNKLLRGEGITFIIIMSIEIYVQYSGEIKFVSYCIPCFSLVKFAVSAF